MRMWILHRHIYQHRFISWLLVVAIFVVALLPMHMHLHHVEEAASQSHEHVVDLHLLMDNSDLSHHESAAVLPVSVDGILKKVSDNPFASALLACLFSLFLLITSYFKQQPPKTENHFKDSHYHFSPPLRAPPLI